MVAMEKKRIEEESVNEDQREQSKKGIKKRYHVQKKSEEI